MISSGKVHTRYNVFVLSHMHKKHLCMSIRTHHVGIGKIPHRSPVQSVVWSPLLCIVLIETHLHGVSLPHHCHWFHCCLWLQGGSGPVAAPLSSWHDAVMVVMYSVVQHKCVFLCVSRYAMCFRHVYYTCEHIHTSALSCARCSRCFLAACLWDCRRMVKPQRFYYSMLHTMMLYSMVQYNRHTAVHPCVAAACAWKSLSSTPCCDCCWGWLINGWLIKAAHAVLIVVTTPYLRALASKEISKPCVLRLRFATRTPWCAASGGCWYTSASSMPPVERFALLIMYCQ